MKRWDNHNQCWIDVLEAPEVPELTKQPAWKPGSSGFEAVLEDYISRNLQIKLDMRRGSTLSFGGGDTLAVEVKLLLNGKEISKASDYRRIS